LTALKKVAGREEKDRIEKPLKLAAWKKTC
jgi:hypothetical protein